MVVHMLRFPMSPGPFWRSSSRMRMTFALISALELPRPSLARAALICPFTRSNTEALYVMVAISCTRFLTYVPRLSGLPGVAINLL